MYLFVHYPKCSTCQKAKAWLDLTERKNAGENVDSKNIRKHKNDVFRLTALLRSSTPLRSAQNDSGGAT